MILQQVIVYSDDDYDDGLEHNVPFVADVRVPDVGQHGLAVPQPALIHAQD